MLQLDIGIFPYLLQNLSAWRGLLDRLGCNILLIVVVVIQLHHNNLFRSSFLF